MHEQLRVLVGALGPGELPAVRAPAPPEGTILIDLGPEHPGHAGLIELRLWTDSAVIVRAEVVVGAMHRGAEKLFEVRDYRQILLLADRHDWHAPFSGELMIALACEELLGLALPERAVWLRTLLAEHTRIGSHLGFLTPLGLSNLSAVREELREQARRLSGNRIHWMINRIGGLAADADPEWLASEQQIAARVRTLGDQLTTLIDSPEVAQRTVGVAPIDRTTIEQYGLSGPTARASGVDLDLRIRQPYLGYAELADRLEPVSATAGDAASRMRVLIHELMVSADLITACVDRLAETPGPVSVKLGKIVRLPEGETYRAVEAPLGIAGAFVVSRGEKTPWRLKLRTPSFANVSSLETVLVGVTVDEIETTLASIGYVVGDIDR